MSGMDALVLIASGDSSLTARICDVASGEVLKTFAGHTAIPLSAIFSPDSTQILTSSMDGSAKLWDVASGECLRSFADAGKKWFCATFSPGGDRILVGGSDGTATLLDAASGESLKTFSGHQDPVYSAAFSRDGAQILTGSMDGSAKLWDVASGECLKSFDGGHGTPSSCLRAVLEELGTGMTAVFSPDGARILTAGYDNKATMMDIETGDTLQTFETTQPITSAVFSPNGDQVLTSGFDERARLWDVASGGLVSEFYSTDICNAGENESRGGPVFSAHFSQDGSRILCAQGSRAWIWDVASDECVNKIECAPTICGEEEIKNSDRVRAAVFAPQGFTLG